MIINGIDYCSDGKCTKSECSKVYCFNAVEKFIKEDNKDILEEIQKEIDSYNKDNKLEDFHNDDLLEFLNQAMKIMTNRPFDLSQFLKVTHWTRKFYFRDTLSTLAFIFNKIRSKEDQIRKTYAHWGQQFFDDLIEIYWENKMEIKRGKDWRDYYRNLFNNEYEKYLKGEKNV